MPNLLSLAFFLAVVLWLPVVRALVQRPGPDPAGHIPVTECLTPRLRKCDRVSWKTLEQVYVFPAISGPLNFKPWGRNDFADAYAFI